MTPEILLRGNRYQSRFIAEQQSSKYIYRGGTHYKYRYYWEGDGLITDTETNEESRFLFRTPRSIKSIESLEQAIISFRSRYCNLLERPEITDYPALIDLVLKSMYTRAKEQTHSEHKIVPRVESPSLEIEELEKQGIVL